MRADGSPFTLQHDNAPQHTARATVRWLADHPEVSHQFIINGKRVLLPGQPISITC